jgi:hypothetical protein
MREIRLIKIFLFSCLLFLIAGCGGSTESPVKTPSSPTESARRYPGTNDTPESVDSPTATALPVIVYDELTKVIVSAQTFLIASPSHPNSKLTGGNIEPGESVYLLGADYNSAWLLVLHRNILGWIPSIYSNSGIGTLNSVTISVPQGEKCSNYKGALLTSTGIWESTTNSVLVQGYAYLSPSNKSSQVSLVIQLQETGKDFEPQIDHISLDSGGEILSFSYQLEGLQLGSHIKFVVNGLNSKSIPFQAAFYSPECNEQTPDVQIGQTTGSQANSMTPMPTRVVRIVSPNELPEPLESTSQISEPSTSYRTDKEGRKYCPGAPPIRVEIGDTARVTSTSTTTQNGIPYIYMRLKPEVGKNIQWYLYAGTIIQIIDGPKCANDVSYFLVKDLSTGHINWVQEAETDTKTKNYYIEPVP